MTDQEIKKAIEDILDECEDWRIGDDGGAENYFDHKKAILLLFQLIKRLENDAITR